jgi:hypothetical protein
MGPGASGEYARALNRCDPCLFVSCKFNLTLDVNPRTGSIKLNFPDREVWEMERTCALAVAEGGDHTLEDVAALANLTRERVRQIEAGALGQLRVHLPVLREAAAATREPWEHGGRRVPGVGRAELVRPSELPLVGGS